MDMLYVIMHNFISEIKVTHIDIIHYIHGSNKAMLYHVFQMDLYTYTCSYFIPYVFQMNSIYTHTYTYINNLSI